MSEAVTPAELEERIDEALEEHEHKEALEELEERIEELEDEREDEHQEEHHELEEHSDEGERDQWSEHREQHQAMLASQAAILESLSELKSSLTSVPEEIARDTSPEALEVEIPEPAEVPNEEGHRASRHRGILSGRLSRRRA